MAEKNKNGKTTTQNSKETLVIVESPSKATTIGKFLGDGYKVMSSKGHIRDLPENEKTDSKTKKRNDIGIIIDPNKPVKENYEPIYEIPADKKKVVAELKAEAKKASEVLLASDEDREGEAIAWHLYKVLGLTKENSKRIVFHEITKNAILDAIKKPREIDENLVDAQQARRVLDRLVGYELSPVLWRKIKRGLSAGRVQSVAVRLLVDREREIQAFETEAAYRVTGEFTLKDENGGKATIKSELKKKFKTKEEAMLFVEKCKNADFTISNIAVKPGKKSPAPPFTTSTLQQEAARKLYFPVRMTMRIAQSLYEAGQITYMRTDSVNLSSLAMNTAKEAITDNYGKEYSKPRNFHTTSKGAQEAHEAIRPTFIANRTITGTAQEKKLYDLIWKRTVASQMAEAQTEKTTATISISTADETFEASGEVIKFDGFLKVYQESTDDDAPKELDSILPPLKNGDKLGLKTITATERFSQHPARYTEASLVKKLEELGIGRPSTYASIISTIQDRGYVEKGELEGKERIYNVISLNSKGTVKDEEKSEITGQEKGKLIPTDTGKVVTEYLDNSFSKIMDYNFTANVEKDFDKIAEGKANWKESIDNFYKPFHETIEDAKQTKQEHRVGERILGEDPATGEPVSAKIGRFGPMIQIGSKDDDEKPRFASLKKGQSIETITLEEALELFKLPRTLGEYEGKTVTVAVGRFGPYVRHDSKFVSIPKEQDPMSISLEEAISLIETKRESDKNKTIKTFAEDSELTILNGRYGAYIKYKTDNIKIPDKKTRDSRELAEKLTYDDVMKIVNEAAKGDKTTKKKPFRKRKA